MKYTITKLKSTELRDFKLDEMRTRIRRRNVFLELEMFEFTNHFNSSSVTKVSNSPVGNIIMLFFVLNGNGATSIGSETVAMM